MEHHRLFHDLNPPELRLWTHPTVGEPSTSALLGTSLVGKTAGRTAERVLEHARIMSTLLGVRLRHDGCLALLDKLARTPSDPLVAHEPTGRS